MGVWMELVVELDNIETAPVHVEVNISFLEIWSNGFPGFGARKFHFNRVPRLQSQAPTLLACRYEKE